MRHAYEPSSPIFADCRFASSPSKSCSLRAASLVVAVIKLDFIATRLFCPAKKVVNETGNQKQSGDHPLALSFG